MRGTDETIGSLFSYVDLKERIPARHSLRKNRQFVDDAFASLSGEFEALYTDFGHASIPPERLIRASLLQILLSVRSERQWMEQMDYTLMFRWFVTGEVSIIGVDLAKSEIQMHGAPSDGSVVFWKKLSRQQLSDFVASPN